MWRTLNRQHAIDANDFVGCIEKRQRTQNHLTFGLQPMALLELAHNPHGVTVESICCHRLRCLK